MDIKKIKKEWKKPKTEEINATDLVELIKTYAYTDTCGIFYR